MFKRAGKQGHDLEIPECEAMALEEILLKRCQDEELVVDAERRAAADAHFGSAAPLTQRRHVRCRVERAEKNK